MNNRRVKVGKVYLFDPVPFDQIYPPDGGVVEKNEKVRVINKQGCPPANTMGQCYIERVDDTANGKAGQFLGLVHTGSLMMDHRDNRT